MDENGWVLIQIRITISLPKIYREVTEGFPKTFQIFSGNVFDMIPQNCMSIPGS